MSGPRGLVALALSATAGIVFGTLAAQEGWSWWYFALLLAFVVAVNALAAVGDSLAGWRMWRKHGGGR